MQTILGKSLFAFCCLNITFNFLSSVSFEEKKKIEMIQDLEVIKYHFEVGYAPAKWKEENSGWNLEKAFEHAKNQILSSSSLTTKQFQRIIRNFVNTMKDYHADVLFFSTEAATLPFYIKGAEGRYFIDWVDPLRLPPSHYSISIGDEILEFDERPIAEVIEELKRESSKFATQSTDQTLAEIRLTQRLGQAGDVVPQGSILIKTRSKDTGKNEICQLCWSYTPENIKNPFDFLQSFDRIETFLSSLRIKKFIQTSSPSTTTKSLKAQLPQISMMNPLHERQAKKCADRKGGLGSTKSFVPMLGEPLWIKEDDLGEDEELQGPKIKWHAYIYLNSDGQSIGYIRIPHYVGFSRQAQEFGEILNFLEENTDALVIDQVHNFGGYVAFQYELASMLAIEPLRTPYHRIKITQKEVFEALEMLELIKRIELILGNEESVDSSDPKDEDKKDDYNEHRRDNRGFNYQEVMFLKTYYELILEEWNRGVPLTRPTPILGVDRINPNPKYQYTKPILMLINEMDFSGADFMPAILQDNKRALLFGSRTAGAGGFVFAFEFPNTHGIAVCSYTASIAERTNSQKIENLGVAPDINYQITALDLQDGYQGYVEGVNKAVQLLFENGKNDN